MVARDAEMREQMMLPLMRSGRGRRVPHDISLMLSGAIDGAT
jgi:hypothetical protein